MSFVRMPLEDWFDEFQYEVDYDIGESAVGFRTLGDLGLDLRGVDLRYGHHGGLPALREVVAGDHPGRTADEVLITSGASEALFLLFSSLVSRGDHVVIEHPNYPSLAAIPRALGAEVELFDLRREEQFRTDLDRLRALLRRGTKLVALTHPHNPTGSVLTARELDEVVELTRRNGTVLLLDETYRHLAGGTVLPAAASLGEHVVSVSTMSKCFGLAGLRIGWAVTADRGLGSRMRDLREHVTITNNALGEYAALQVLLDPAPHLARASAIVRTNRDIAARWVEEEPGVAWVPPAAGVVALPWLTELGPDEADDAFRRLAAQARTFVVPGRCFEVDHRHFRLGFGGSGDALGEGLRRLSALLAQQRDPGGSRRPSTAAASSSGGRE